MYSYGIWNVYDYVVIMNSSVSFMANGTYVHRFSGFFHEFNFNRYFFMQLPSSSV